MKDHIAASHLKVGVALLEGQIKIKDDLGYPCSRNTTIHNPLDLQDATGLLENMNLGLSSGEKGVLISNKAQGVDIVFEEEFIFLRNFPIMWKINRKKLYI